jgi:hypothetical protein
MRLIPGSYSPTIESLSAVIACSQIVVARPYRTVSSLPVGFDHADMSVLDWIAATGSRPSADLGRVIARDPIPFTGGKEAPENRRSRSAPANPPNGTTAAGRAIRAPWTIPALGTVCVRQAYCLRQSRVSAGVDCPIAPFGIGERRARRDGQKAFPP